MPLVSIIIPTFNASKYIGKVISDVLGQTLDEWELIIVDDGSTDSTIRIINNYTDERIKIILRDREPKGSVTCRNIGQQNATGKYFIHFDADDIIMPYCLEQRVHYMEEHPEVDFATFKGGTVLEQPGGSTTPIDKKWGRPLTKDDLSSFLSTKYPYSVWNNIYRSNKFIKYMWDEKVKIYTDFSYIVPTLIEGKVHAYALECKEDYYYRMGQGNAMTQSFIDDDKYQSTKYLFSKIYSLLNGAENSRRYKNSFYSFFKLQYKRIIIGGNLRQIKDFCLFTKEMYGEKICFQIRLAYLLTVATYSKPKLNRLTKKISSLILQPTLLIMWIMSKVKIRRLNVQSWG